MGDDLQEVMLTLSAVQFERFVQDLKLLREQGAGSNTEAIIAAVRERADTIRVAAVEDRRAAA